MAPGSPDISAASGTGRRITADVTATVRAFRARTGSLAGVRLFPGGSSRCGGGPHGQWNADRPVSAGASGGPALRRDFWHRDAVGAQRLEAADEVAGPVQTELAQRRGGEAGAVALVADDDDASIHVARLRDMVRAGGSSRHSRTL